MEKFHQLPGSDKPEKEPPLDQLLPALCRARKNLRAVALSGNFSGDQEYQYSTWADVCTALDPVMLAEGLVFLPRERCTALGWVMEARLYHAPSGQFVESLAPIRDQDSKDPRDWLGACTHARKGLYLELAGGYSGNGDEESGSVEPARSPEEQELLDKVKSRLELVAGNEAKLRKVFANIDSAVEEGRLKPADAVAFREQYLLPVLEEKTHAK